MYRWGGFQSPYHSGVGGDGKTLTKLQSPTSWPMYLLWNLRRIRTGLVIQTSASDEVQESCRSTPAKVHIKSFGGYPATPNEAINLQKWI